MTLFNAPTRVTAFAVTIRSLISLAIITVLPSFAHAAPAAQHTSNAKKSATAEPKQPAVIAEPKQPVVAAVPRQPAVVTVPRQPAVVAAAFSLRGVRYRFGGTSRSGFDCSGFVRYVLGTGGVALPRTASDQFYNGKPVDKAHLAPGDLVFFKNTYCRGISHVGIYTGNGKFIHACNPSRGVVESSLSEAYYVNHWAGGRRVLSASAQRLPTSGRW